MTWRTTGRNDCLSDRPTARRASRQPVAVRARCAAAFARQRTDQQHRPHHARELREKHQCHTRSAQKGLARAAARATPRSHFEEQRVYNREIKGEVRKKFKAALAVTAAHDPIAERATIVRQQRRQQLPRCLPRTRTRRLCKNGYVCNRQYVCGECGTNQPTSGGLECAEWGTTQPTQGPEWVNRVGSLVKPSSAGDKCRSAPDECDLFRALFFLFS